MPLSSPWKKFTGNAFWSSFFENAIPENIQVLTKYVGDELEILDPYGGALPAYGLCYETLRKSIKKLVKKFNNEEEGA